MQTITSKKEIVELALHEIVLTPNVRHAHMWHLASYNPEELKNYDEKAILEMAITMIDNLTKFKPIFDTEPVVWKSVQGYEVQVGSTRSIVAKNLSHIIERNKKALLKMFTEANLEYACSHDTAMFAVVDVPMTDAEKRRENNVRTDQHWLATAMGYHNDIEAGKTAKELGKQEGKTAKQIVELSNLYHLSNAAKSLCLKGVFSEKVAIHLSKLPKPDQKLVIEYITEKDIPVVRSPKELENMLLSAYTPLDDSYPMEAFKSKTGKAYPHISLEKWYFKIEDGMFTRHLAKSEEKANDRLAAWQELKAEEILAKHPDAKVLEKCKKKMILTSERKCLHAKPYLYKGHMLKYGCNDQNCDVHTWEVELTEEKVPVKDHDVVVRDRKAKRKGFYDKMKEVIRDERVFNLNMLLMALQLLFLRLSKKAKEEVIHFLASTVAVEMNLEHYVIDVEDFNFHNYMIDADDDDGADPLYKLLSVDYNTIGEVITYMMAYYLEDNPSLKTAEKFIFSDFGMDATYLDKVSEDAQETIQNQHKRMAEKVVKASKKRNAIKDFFVHMLGFGTNKVESKLPLLSRRSSYAGPGKVKLIHNKDGWQLVFADLAEEDEFTFFWLMKQVGFTKAVANKVCYPNTAGSRNSNLHKHKALKAINQRLNDMIPLFSDDDYWNQEFEDKAAKNMKRHNDAMIIMEWAQRMFVQAEHELQNGVGSYAIALNIMEGINKNFEGILGSKVSIAKKDEDWMLEEVIKKGRKLTTEVFKHVTEYWFPYRILETALMPREEEYVVTGEDDNYVNMKPVPTNKGVGWQSDLYHAINSLMPVTALNKYTAKINDPDGHLVGLVHHFGQNAQTYNCIYDCANEGINDYLGKKDYEYVRAHDKEEWMPLNILVADPYNRIADVETMLYSKGKCSRNFVIAYAFDKKNLTNQEWWDSFMACNQGLMFSSTTSLADAVKEGAIFKLDGSYEGITKLKLVNINKESTYAVMYVTEQGEWEKPATELTEEGLEEVFGKEETEEKVNVTMIDIEFGGPIFDEEE